MTDEEIKALIQLLDDPDKEVYRMVSENLLSQDSSVVPFLEEAWGTNLNEVVQTRIELIVQQIQYREISAGIRNWKEQNSTDLLEGCYWIARHQYPDLNLEGLREEIRKLSKDIWIELNENLTALEKVRILNHILFEVHRFSGNQSNYYAPQNNYINLVLESKKGNPISLSIVYSLVAKELNIPIYGVNLPKNFILAYKDEFRSDETYDPELDEHILFYINPYNRGAVLGKSELDLFLKQQGLSFHKEYYLPCTNDLIIERLLNNLIYSYQKLGYKEKIEELERLSELLK